MLELEQQAASVMVMVRPPPLSAYYPLLMPSTGAIFIRFVHSSVSGDGGDEDIEYEDHLASLSSMNAGSIENLVNGACPAERLLFN
jgi:hypothetical protein